jgi:putative peptidoglycan lipid II flippase
MIPVCGLRVLSYNGGSSLRSDSLAIDTKPIPAEQKTPEPSIGRSASLIAAGILLSRLFGVFRETIFNHFFGLSYAADAFRAAQRIPNMLQNLLGEGVLSASFIPVYARLLAKGDREEAGRLAGAIFSLLALITSTLVLLGVLATPYLIELIAPGFHGETRRLAIQLVRIFFPGVGFLVLAAWCLGILNSHRKFFLPYVVGVIWNITTILALLIFGGRSTDSYLAVYVTWGAVIGNALQFFVQLPVVLRVLPVLRFTLHANENVRAVIRNFVPVFVSRGVVQISGFIDNLLASKLPTGSLAALSTAQTLSFLPISLFGMSLSAAELPAMSSATGTEQEIAAVLRERLRSSSRRIGFFVIPSAVAFFALGDVVAAAIYQTGRFTHQNAVFVWAILAGSAVGLLAQTIGRLYSSAYYALRDTRTPMRFAVVRVILTTGLGFFFALPLPRLLGIDQQWGTAGLTASAGIAGWVEFILLRRGMNEKIGKVPFPRLDFAKLWGAAVVAAAVALSIKFVLHPARPRVAAVLILIPYGLIYLGITSLLGLNQAGSILNRITRRR